MITVAFVVMAALAALLFIIAMVLVVAVGIDLAGALFIRRMANLTQAQSREHALTALPLLHCVP